MITGIGNGSYLHFRVFNNGAVTARIVEIWLNDTTTNTPRHLSLANYITSNCSAWIGSGVERWMYTTISLISDHTYDMKIATERGNIAIAPRFKTTSESTPTGYQPVPFTFAFGFNDFQYSTAGGATPPPENDPSWQPAWELDQDFGWTWFRIKLKNTAGSDVQIETRSHLNFVTSTKPSVESKANGDAYQTVDIPLGEERWIVFQKIDLGRIPDADCPGTFYLFFALFYHPINPTGPSRGTCVAVLSVYIVK